MAAFDRFQIGATDAQAGGNIGELQAAPFPDHSQAVANTFIAAGSCSRGGGVGPGRAFAGLYTHGHACLLFARSEEHTSELQSLMRNSYAVFCLKKKNPHINHIYI